ncbi:MAG: glycosyltransferase family 4 protein [Pseudomonadota bacterium]
MKVAFISQGFGSIKPPAVSGSISIWTYEVISELKKTNFIVAYEMDGKKLHSVHNNYEGIDYVYAPTLLNTLMNNCHQKLVNLLKKNVGVSRSVRKPIFSSILYNLGYILWVSLNLKKQQCDIIHVHQFSQYVPVLRFFNPKSKIILHMSCEWLTQLDATRMRRRMAKADLILGNSDYISEKIEKKFPKFKGKIKTIYNGVDHKQFLSLDKTPQNDNRHHPKLLFVGRVSPEKGIHVLIGAIKKLVTEYPLIHINIVGSKGSAPKEFIVDLDEQATVKALSKFYGESLGGEDYYYSCLKRLITDDITGHITFCGSMPHASVVEFYQHSDILINPSLSESFGMSLVEAMASGKPTISTRVGGMVNVVSEGETGLLVEPDNEEKLAAAIAFLTEKPEMKKNMGIAGRKRVMEKFSWERVAESTLNEYLRLISKP